MIMWNCNYLQFWLKSSEISLKSSEISLNNWYSGSLVSRANSFLENLQFLCFALVTNVPNKWAMAKKREYKSLGQAQKSFNRSERTQLSSL